ncbi:Serine/threonine protein kinase [Minicystis rosea]|nr:Serine/threonine protein kinase [Minicystis rosea]
MKPGAVIAGKYQLESRLGVGGMGEVWRATHLELGRPFALKFMHAYAAASQTARRRFAREARVSAKINHPNVIEVLDVDELDDGVLFLAMELLEGVSLAEALYAEQPLTVQEFLTVMLDTARALGAAHLADVVHRDIKPGNIFLHRDASGFASAKILDFGISKLTGVDDSHHTKSGVVLGSPRYMSPEQTRSAAAVDGRTDIWSLGVILFEGLTGTWPHEGDSFTSLVVAICTSPPASIDQMAPDLPEALRSIVRDCLKPPAERIQSAHELEARLAAVVLDPRFTRVVLPRPQHPPNEMVRSVVSVRVRPPLFASGSPDSLRSTSAREKAVPYEDDATQVRPMSPSLSDAFDADSFDATSIMPLRDALAAAPSPKAPRRTIQLQAAPERPLQPAAELAPPQPFSPPARPQPFSPPAPPQPFSPHASSASLPAYAAPPQAFSPPSAAQAPPPQPFSPPSMAQAAPPQPFSQQAFSPPSGALAPVPPFSQATLSPRASALAPSVQQRPSPAFASPAAPAPPLTSTGGDPLVGTASSMSFEMRAESVLDSQARAPVAAMPLAPMAAPRPAGGRSLMVMAAVLSVLLALIGLALVSVLRSPSSSSASASSATASGLAATAPSSSSAQATTEPAAAPKPSATASAIPALSATATASVAAIAPAAPSASGLPAADKPKSRPAPKGPSKVQQLGSGL